MSNNFLKDYLMQIGIYNVLTEEDEMRYGKMMLEGTPDERDWARTAMINHNLKLVVYIAKNYHNTHLPLEDLIMEGNLGLVTAVDKFDYKRGFRFSTCATPWIKQAILKAITDKGKSIRLPAHIYAQLNKMRDAIAAFEAESHFNPTDAEIAARMGVEESKVAMLKTWRKDAISLSTPLNDEEKNTLEDVVGDYDSISPVEYADQEYKRYHIQEMLKSYPERTRTIIKMRYGCGAEGDPEEFFTEHTLEQIGDYLGITRERVRQIEKETLQDMKLKWKN